MSRSCGKGITKRDKPSHNMGVWCNREARWPLLVGGTGSSPLAPFIREFLLRCTLQILTNERTQRFGCNGELRRRELRRQSLCFCSGFGLAPGEATCKLEQFSEAAVSIKGRTAAFQVLIMFLYPNWQRETAQTR